MNIIRTFVAVLIADEIKNRILKAQEQVRKLAPDVKWVAPENFHVTLKFLGNIEEEKLPEVYEAVESVSRRYSPFNLSISGIGAFPKPERARVVWVGIQDGSEHLKNIANAIDLELAKIGFEKEKREFKSHITIGRVKTNAPTRELARGIYEVDAQGLGSQQVDCVVVMQSDLQLEGPVYSPLKVIKLS